MTEINYEKIAEVINDHAHPRANKLDADDVGHLIRLYGFEVIGSLIESLKGDQQLRDLCEAGVPFDEAAKVLGWSERGRAWSSFA